MTEHPKEEGIKQEPKVKMAESKKPVSEKRKLTKEGGSMVTKTLGNTDQNGCRKNVSDVVIFGEDLFKLLSKASSEKEGWMKSTKAMDTGTGCVVQVTTQQRNLDGSYSVAEAVTFVPQVRIKEQFSEDNVEVTGRSLAGVR